jgi:puromycin-sensitive aminopeptidase
VDPARGTFGGEVTIRLELSRPQRSIELHAADLKIDGATWQADRNGREARRGRIIPHRDRETAEVRFPSRVHAGTGMLTLRFTATLQPGLRGLYGVHAGGNAYAFSQLEAADARRFFPCFDEPSFKARFTFRVTTDAANAVVSNAPAVHVEDLPYGDRTVEFAPTPKLSTYLCALAVGPLECSQPRLVGSTPVRVWHIPGKGHLTATALEVAAESLVRLEQYFGVPYPYQKLDLVAVPDFEAGAMENAGAVFFRETLVLADRTTLTLLEYKRLAEVIAHELAHMWYGNLVTMAWWNDLWLNEAFATWMAFRVVDDWKPEWKMWNNFEHHRAAALSMDALTHTHPVYGDVDDVAEATENFDAITYEKGAAVIGMIERYLGADAFRDGIRRYIRQHREGNATARDLWQALGEASRKPVEHIVRRWIETPGFPLLTVRAEQDGGVVGFAVRQERFFASPRVRNAARRGRWPIPWVVKYQSGGGAGPAVARYLIETSTDHLILDASGLLRWYYGNADEGGFFRVHYDDRNLADLTAALPDALTPVERMGLVSNQWALVRSGGATLESFLQLVDGFGAEPDPDVLEYLAAALDFIEAELLDAAGAAAREAFCAWLERRFMPQLIQLGWDPKPAESDETRLRRGAIVRILGETARVPAVCSTAGARGTRYLQDRSSLDANLVDSVVAIGARDGGTARFDRYRAAVREAPTPQERRRFQLALAAFRIPELIDRSISLTLTDEVPSQDVVPLLIRALHNPAARERTWRFITRRWAQLQRRLPPMMISRLIEATPLLQTQALKREVATFFRAHPVETGKRALKQALERFDLNSELRRRAAPMLANWLGCSQLKRAGGTDRSR